LFSSQLNRAGGVLVSVLVSRADGVIEVRSGRTKDCKIDICCFSAKHTVLRNKNKDWLVRNQDNGNDCIMLSHLNLCNNFCSYVQIHDLKRNNPSLKTSLALGGWTAGSIAYSRMASTVDSRRQFIQSAVKYLRDHKFDGLDMDWEYPANRGGAHEDKKNFGLLAKVM